MTVPPAEHQRELHGRERCTWYSLYAGSAIPIVFFATTIVCGFVLGDYNHLTRLVSELGAVGTPTQYLFSAGLLLCALLSIPFFVALLRTCRANGISVLPVLPLVFFTISIGGAGLFPLPLRMHLLAGMPSSLLILSPVLSLFLWSKLPRLRRIREISLLSLFVMCLGFLAFIPGIMDGEPGLKQRFFHLGWSIWFFSLSYSFRTYAHRMPASER